MTEVFELLCCLLLIMVMFLLVLATIYVAIIVYQEIKDEIECRAIVNEFAQKTKGIKHDTRPVIEQLNEVFGKKEK